MNASRGIRKLIDDAKAAGLKVREEHNYVDIKRKRPSLGLVIFEDGVAVRNDVDLSVCTAIRTQKQMRKILGL